MDRSIVMNIDWKLLRRQKATLLGVIVYLKNQHVDLLIDDLNGILQLVDSLQDEAVDSGAATEDEVFGESEE